MANQHERDLAVATEHLEAMSMEGLEALYFALTSDREKVLWVIRDLCQVKFSEKQMRNGHQS